MKRDASNDHNSVSCVKYVTAVADPGFTRLMGGRQSLRNMFLKRQNKSTESDQARHSLLDFLLPPANQVCEGHVFIPVCQSFCSQGGAGSASVHAGIVDPTRSRHPLRADTPATDTPPCAVHAGRYGQQAGGTHPIGMHTCCLEKITFGEYSKLDRYRWSKCMQHSSCCIYQKMGVAHDSRTDPELGLRSQTLNSGYCSSSYWDTLLYIIFTVLVLNSILITYSTKTLEAAAHNSQFRISETGANTGLQQQPIIWPFFPATTWWK